MIGLVQDPTPHLPRFLQTKRQSSAYLEYRAPASPLERFPGAPLIPLSTSTSCSRLRLIHRPPDSVPVVQREAQHEFLEQSFAPIGINSCWLTAVRDGPISGRKRTRSTQSCDFRLKNRPFRAKRDAQKSVNYILAARINHARPFGAQQKITHILTYRGFTKQTQSSPDIKERPPDRAFKNNNPSRGLLRGPCRKRRRGSLGRGPQPGKLRRYVQHRQAERAALDRVGDAASDKVPGGGRAFLPSVNHDCVASPVERAGRLGGAAPFFEGDQTKARPPNETVIRREWLCFARQGDGDRHGRIGDEQRFQSPDGESLPSTTGTVTILSSLWPRMKVLAKTPA